MGVRLGKLLIAIAGADDRILRRVPTERVKFQSLGWAILITSGIAAVSMWFALANALGLNPVLALPLALLWGLVIMGIDRWLITSIPPHGSRRWAVAVPRLVLALLLGSIISTPIVLRIFQTEINNEIAQIDTQRANAYIASQQNSQIAAKVNYWQAQVTNLEGVINSRGQTPLNFSADPQIQSLTKQLNTWLGLQQTYYDQWQCQLYGIAPDGLRCKPGNGPLAQNSHGAYEQAKQQVVTINDEIAARKTALSSNGAVAAATRLQEAQGALPQAQAELQNYRSQQDNLRNQYESTLPRNGLLIRLQALGQLSSRNFTVTMARLLIFLLFLVIECLPVTVKLMQRPGNYERALEKASEVELRAAIRDIRESDGIPDETTLAYERVPESRVDDEVREWWQPTVTMPDPDGPMPSQEGTPPPGPFGKYQNPAVPRTLRDLNPQTVNVNGRDDSPEARGGSQLRLDDDNG
jgi:Domain of unknown function (DUF4407)